MDNYNESTKTQPSTFEPFNQPCFDISHEIPATPQPAPRKDSKYLMGLYPKSDATSTYTPNTYSPK